MGVFRKILYSTDFSPLAEYALKFTEKLKEAGAEEVVIISVVADLTMELPDETDLTDETVIRLLPPADRSYVKDLTERMFALKGHLESVGFSVKVYLIAGQKPADLIVKTADRENVNVIVMGAHGKGLLTEIIIGSVSLAVVRKSKKPVLVVKGEPE